MAVGSRTRFARLSAQDTSPSSWRGGFDSRTDHFSTRRVAELVDARASDARAPEAWEFESPPGDFDCGWAGARPSLISSESWVRHPDPQLCSYDGRVGKLAKPPV